MSTGTAVAQDVHDGRLVGVLADLFRQLTREVDGAVVHLYDDVAGLDAGLLGRVAGVDAAHVRVRVRVDADVADLVLAERCGDDFDGPRLAAAHDEQRHLARALPAMVSSS
jgi:hypothetical protein